MSAQYDLVVRGGTVVDGTGAEPYPAEIAIVDGRIARVGTVEGTGREEIDASGCIVTPGFVDIHTHYDGHATWAERLAPSSHHGVTTVVMGNCGVGFAPCKPQDRDRLVRLMEGVEDIPEVVLDAGLPWTWQSFPEYLDVLASRSYDMDVAAYLPHAPLRVFVMGERAARREPATQQDIAGMRAIAAEAMRAGALGFATSRSIFHKSSDGEVTPSYAAAEGELAGILQGLGEVDAGVFQLISDFDEPEAEFAMLRRVAGQAGRPLTVSLLQNPAAPERWEKVLHAAETALAEGQPVTTQVCGRPIGLLAGLELSQNPFTYCPSYRLIAGLPLAERLERMRDPALRAKITREVPADQGEMNAAILRRFDGMYLMSDPPDYEPRPEDSLAAMAAREGREPAEFVYDLLTSGDGRTILYIPAANYVGNSIGAVEKMLRSKVTVPGLGDGGAHCGLVCDASLPTYMLLRWTGEAGGRFTLPAMVKALSNDTAAAVGLVDRGRIEPGLRADLNVIALDRLELRKPDVVHDLPTGGRRLDQRADGYVATLVAGIPTYREGRATGALPGRLVRGGAAVA